MEERIRKLADQIEDHEERIRKIEKLITAEELPVVKGSYSSSEEVIDSFKSLDLSEYGYIFDLSGLALYLAILRVSRNELGMDGLTAPEISDICKEKIRKPSGVDRTTISNALSDAGALVDRIDNPRGRGYAYRIMREGEEFLDNETDSIRD